MMILKEIVNDKPEELEKKTKKKKEKKEESPRILENVPEEFRKSNKKILLEG